MTAICSTQCISLNVNLNQKHPHRNSQNDIWPNIWAHHGPRKLHIKLTITVSLTMSKSSVLSLTARKEFQIQTPILRLLEQNNFQINLPYCQESLQCYFLSNFISRLWKYIFTQQQKSHRFGPCPAQQQLGHRVYNVSMVPITVTAEPWIKRFIQIWDKTFARKVRPSMSGPKAKPILRVDLLSFPLKRGKLSSAIQPLVSRFTVWKPVNHIIRKNFVSGSHFLKRC